MLQSSESQSVPQVKQYHIFHSTEKEYIFTEHEKQTRVYVGFVHAESLQDAFTRSQNGKEINGSEYDQWNIQNPCRSTSVGDIIQDNLGFHLVMNQGFKFLFPNDDPEGSE